MIRHAINSLYVLMLAALASTAASLFAQTFEELGVVEGRVFGVLSSSYLENARVTLKGTRLMTFTDSSGSYRLDGAPVGTAEVEVFYTGYEPVSELVEVNPGAVARQDFRLRLKSGQSAEEVYELDAVTVAASREYNAEAIAINEQRFASTIKNVVSTDAFGEINQGNIGEFLKHVPGVTIEVKDGNSPSGIQVRGFNSNYTNVTIDGGTIASAALANTNNHTRQFQLETANINNLARIEVTKLPTADMPANSLGGSVNLVSKTAFDRAEPEFRYSAYLSGNGEALTFGKRAGAGRGEERVILPSFDMSYILPINDKIGVVMTYAHSNQFSMQEQAVPIRWWGGEDGDEITTPEDPFTHRLRYSTGGNRSERNSGSFKIDYKPAEAHMLSVSAQANAFKNEASNRSIDIDAGRELADWGETYATGNEGEGRVTLGGSSQVRHGLTQALAGTYTFRQGQWKAELGANYSYSSNQTRDFEKGFFKGVSTQLVDPTTDSYDRDLRIDLVDINNSTGDVGSVKVYAEDGSEIDYTDLSNYILKGGSGEHFVAGDELVDVRGSVRYDFQERPISVEFGFAQNDLTREINKTSYNWTYLGPDGIAETLDNTLEGFEDEAYSGSPVGQIGDASSQERPSPFLIYDSLESNPSFWEYSSSAAGDTAKNQAVRSPLVEETITAYYAMADGRFFDNKLRLVGGLRYELTENSGWGYKQDPDAVFQTDASGEFILDDEGERIRKPEAGEPGSAADQALIYQFRGQYNERDYDGLYPSLSGVYHLTNDLQLRFGYARTIGRPATVDIIPYLYVQENIWNPDESGSYPGWVVAGNSTLEPWQAHNYDLSLEYYLPSHGLISVSVFYKDISDFFGDEQVVVDEQLAEELNLDEETIGYSYETRINAGDAKIRGLELNWNQPLEVFGLWGEGSSVFANYTKLDLEGSNQADFSDFIPESANLGYRYAKGRWSTMIKWNYRGKQFREEYGDLSPDGGEYIRSRVQIDANLEYQLNEYIAIFAAGRNITNNPNQWEVTGSLAPEWSSLTSYTTFGAQYSLGVKGSF